MVKDNYKLKYIKYKKKYIELKKIQNDLENIKNKIIILPNEYQLLNDEIKNTFEAYELNKLSIPISYIKKDYKKKIGIDEDNNNTDESSIKEENIIIKKVITPNEYYLLSDANKSLYEINESDYDKFPNRVVPKNYKKIAQE